MKKIGFQNPTRKILKKNLYIDLRELTFKIRLPKLPQSFINIFSRDCENLLRRFWFHQKKLFFNLPYTNHIFDEIDFLDDIFKSKYGWKRWWRSKGTSEKIRICKNFKTESTRPNLILSRYWFDLGRFEIPISNTSNPMTSKFLNIEGENFEGNSQGLQILIYEIKYTKLVLSKLDGPQDQKFYAPWILLQMSSNF